MRNLELLGLNKDSANLTLTLQQGTVGQLKSSWKNLILNSNKTIWEVTSPVKFLCSIAQTDSGT